MIRQVDFYITIIKLMKVDDGVSKYTLIYINKATKFGVKQC